MISTSYIILASPIFLTCDMWYCIVIHINGLNHRLYLLQLCGQLLLVVLHRVVHMIHRRLHNFCSLHLSLVFLQRLLYPCNDIAHHFGMMHTRVSTVRSDVSLSSLWDGQKLSKLHPRLLYFRHEIPLANRQPKLACSVEYDICDVDSLYMCIQCPPDVRELKKFLDCREHGCNWVVQVVKTHLHDVLTFKKLVWHQLTLAVLQMREYACHGVIYIYFVLLQISAKYASSTVPIIFLDRACSTPVTSQYRRTSLVCVIHILEFAWEIVPSVLMRGPGWVR